MMTLRHNIQDDTFRFEDKEHNIETSYYSNIEHAREIYDILLSKEQITINRTDDNVIANIGLPGSSGYYNKNI